MVTGDSQEEVIIFRDRQTDRQTLHHNIYIIIIIIILFFLVPGSRTVGSTRMLAKSVSSSRRQDVARSAMPASLLSRGDDFIRVSCFSDD